MQQVNKQLFGVENRFASFLARTDQKQNIRTHMTALFSRLQDLRLLPNDPVLVDIGCGEGELTVPLFKELSRHASSSSLVAIDPSSTMTDHLQRRLSEEEIKGRVITDGYFNKDNFKLSDYFNERRGDVVVCSHVIYYAKNVGIATGQIFQAVEDNGFLVSVHQSKQSQMHQLRNNFSSASERYPVDNEPITADHMEHHIQQEIGNGILPKLSYQSSLWFSLDSIKFLKEFKAIIMAQNNEQGAFDGLLTKYGEECAVDRNVVEFILRQNVFEQKPAEAEAYLDAVVDLLEKNPRTQNGLPRIIISESISFAGRTAASQNSLAQLVSGYD
jgi:ubiquinone/menaquinone biosynthesis C-methylase UbiE